MKYTKDIGYSRLHEWFGLSRASFLVAPRVLLQEMPDDWQLRLAALMHRYDDEYPYMPNVTPVVSLKNYETKEFVKIPDWMLNYRHPDYDVIDRIRGDLK